LQASAEPMHGHYPILEPYGADRPLPPVIGKLHREEGTLEFLHTLSDLLGGICKAGFCIDDFSEADHGDRQAAKGSFAHRSAFLPTFMSIKAIRREDRQARTIIT